MLRHNTVVTKPAVAPQASRVQATSVEELRVAELREVHAGPVALNKYIKFGVYASWNPLHNSVSRNYFLPVLPRSEMARQRSRGECTGRGRMQSLLLKSIILTPMWPYVF